MSKRLTYILGGLLVLAIVSVAGLGYWGYQTSTALQAAQKQLNVLQAEQDALKANHAQLTADHEQQGATLEAVQADLVSAQADLETAGGEKAALRSKLDLAHKLYEVVDSVFVATPNDNIVGQRVRATGDAKLTELWNALTKKPSNENGLAFTSYLFDALEAAFK